ncbi:unnamed protein product, partial [Didymodactylos carnosus]
MLLNKRKAHNRNLSSKRWCTGNFFDKPPQQQSSSSEDEEFINLQPDTIDFTNKQISTAIGDLYTLCPQQCHPKFLSIMIYMTLTHLNLSWRDTDQLSSFGTIGILTCHKWAKTFLCEDFNDFVSENRGGKHTDGFYDVFPELEIQDRAFVVDACSQKSSSFKAADLAAFIDECYYKINNLKKSANNLILSIKSCRLGIRRWGGRHEADRNRPYSEGHERLLHPSSPFFRLNQEEWNEATKKYSELLQDSDITCEKHSASAAINIGGDLYMDNSLVLEQFERFFK